MNAPPLDLDKFKASFSVDPNVEAAIFGARESQRFFAIDATTNALALRAADQEAPFREGTLIEVTVSLEHISKPGVKEPFTLVGKVTKVEVDENTPEHGKVICSVQLVNMSKKDVFVWSNLVESLKVKIVERNESLNEPYSEFLSRAS